MTPEAESIERTAIRHLQSIYNTAGDRGRIDELINVFAEDGVLEVPHGEHRGRAAISAFLKRVVTGSTGTVKPAGSRHHLTTSRIEFEGPDSALGWTYFFVSSQGIMSEEGLYVDKYKREAGEWRIAHRRVKMLWMAATSVKA